jgi:hypothetical protein
MESTTDNNDKQLKHTSPLAKGKEKKEEEG